MYGLARGVGPSRDVAGSMQNAMMGRGMTGFAQGMQQHNIPNVMPQQSPFDLYGNPIGVM